MQDLRYACRSLLRAPAFTVSAVVTLAVAVAINTVVFTLLYSLVWRGMPVRDPDAVVRVFPVDADAHRRNLFSYRDYQQIEPAALEAQLAAYAPVIVTIHDGEAVRDGLAYAVSASYFPLLGIHPAIGRAFTAADESDRDARVAIISYARWVRAFRRSERVLGEAAIINGHRFTIVGVGPAAFGGTEPLDPDFWVPLSAQPLVSPADRLEDADAAWLLVVGRLAPGRRADTLEAVLDVAAARIGGGPGAGRGRPHGVQVTTATFFHAGAEVRPVIALVLSVVALVLVIAAANIANLVLTRAAVRQKELSIRMALGAGRWRMARLLLTENLIVASIGGVAGLLLSAWIIRVLYPVGISLLPFRWATVVLDLTPNVTVAVYSLGLAAAAGVAFALAPWLLWSRRSVVGGLRSQSMLLGTDRRGSRIRRGLVIAQIAVCFTLLAAAALTQRALARTETLDLGFRTTGVVYTSADLVRHGYTGQATADFHRHLMARAAALPAVTDVALTTHVPLTGGVRRVGARPEGHDQAPPTMTTSRGVSPGYFRTIGIALESGRDFTPAETTAGMPVAVISSALARRFWPGVSALGRRIGVEGRALPLTVVGVARDAREAAIWREKEIALYLPADLADRALHVIVRTAGDPALVAWVLRNQAQQFDPHVRLDAEPLDAVLRLWLLPSRIAAITAAVLGGIALVIATVGVYGVMAYAAAQRRQEIGLRVALGATPRDVRNLLLSDGRRLIYGGLAIGTLGAAVVMRALAAFLPGAAGADPIALAAAATTLVGAALAGCYWPARAAARQDPLAALRTE